MYEAGTSLQVVEAWHKLIVTARLFDPPPATLLYDLVDVGRQVKLLKHRTLKQITNAGR